MDSMNKSSTPESLAQAKHIAKFEGEREIDRKGLEYGGEKVVRCMNCDEDLFTIMSISDRPTKFPIGAGRYKEVASQRFKSKCPFCDSDSWTVKVDGQVMLGAVEGRTVIDNYNYGDFDDPEGMLTIPILCGINNG